MANEKRLIDANELKKNYTYLWDEALGTCECVLVEDIEAAPTVDAVSRCVLDQVRWERDTALEQLEEHGISFGCIAPDVVKVVRCKDCEHGIWDEEEQMWECLLSVDLTGDPDTYAMFHEYNYGEHFCSYGERKGGEK